MKKRFRILALILTLALALLPIIAVPVSAETNDEYGKLAITELNTRLVDTYKSDGTYYGTSYQFMEVTNVSDTVADLSDYYVFRYGFDNVNRVDEWGYLSDIINGYKTSSLKRQIHKVKLTDTSVELAKNEVAVIWFCNDISKTEADFRTQWGISQEVTVIKTDITAYPAYSMFSGANPNVGSGFLPDTLDSCVIELINKNIPYAKMNAATDSKTMNEDFATTQARHAAADSLAIISTDALNGGSIEHDTGIQSRNYYSYVDGNRYNTGANTARNNASNVEVISAEIMNTYGKNFVHGKLSATDSYAIDAGLKKYLSTNPATSEERNYDSGVFLDDGTKNNPTPGVLLNGQFGFEAGKLAITELNTRLVDTYKDNNYYGTSYQFMEVTNVSDNIVDLNDYYVFRYGFDNLVRADEWGYLSDIINGYKTSSLKRQIHKVKLTDTSVELAKNEVAVIWFCNDISKTEADFRTQWGISQEITVIKTDTTAYPAYSMFSGVNPNAGSGFLPVTLASCVIEVINKDAPYAKMNAATDSKTMNEDFATTQARHAAADSLAIISTDDFNDKVVDYDLGTQSRSYYSYVDGNRYNTGANTARNNASNVEVISAEIMNTYGKNFVHGKLSATDSYAIDAGLKKYVSTNPAASEERNYDSGIFLDDGTKETPTPGTLAKGQFDFVLNAPTYFGVQSKLNGDGTYSVRFSATVDEEVLNCAKLGFDIKVSAVKSNGETVNKTLDKDCWYVYTSIYGKGTDGAEQYETSDIKNSDDYFYVLTVKNISIENYENVTFTVTPRVQVGNNTAVLYGKTTTVICNDGVISQQ